MYKIITWRYRSRITDDIGYVHAKITIDISFIGNKSVYCLQLIMSQTALKYHQDICKAPSVTEL